MLPTFHLHFDRGGSQRDLRTSRVAAAARTNNNTFSIGDDWCNVLEKIKFGVYSTFVGGR